MNVTNFNDNFTRYPGYDDNGTCYKYLFDPKTIRGISGKVSELLMGVDIKNRKIIVPDDVIGSVISNIYVNFVPSTGDIYSRYNIPSKDVQSVVAKILDQAIEVIVSDVKNNLEMAQNNAKLTVWTTVYGDFNEHGLRQHPPIKTLLRRPNPMEFNMNY